MELFFLHPTHIPQLWDEIEPFITECLEKATDGEWHQDDIYKDLLEQRMLGWVVMDDKETIKCVVVTQIIQYPRKRTCQIFLCCGKDAKLWYDHIDSIKKYAKQQECQVLEIIGRPGWEKVLNDQGFKKTDIRLRHIL